MSRKTGRNGRGFGKALPKQKPNYEGARQAAMMLALAVGRDVELRKCNNCKDYFHFINSDKIEHCEICGQVNYEVVSRFVVGSNIDDATD